MTTLSNAMTQTTTATTTTTTTKDIMAKLKAIREAKLNNAGYVNAPVGKIQLAMNFSVFNTRSKKTNEALAFAKGKDPEGGDIEMIFSTPKDATIDKAAYARLTGVQTTTTGGRKCSGVEKLTEAKFYELVGNKMMADNATPTTTDII